ncbi:MAG: hypothetical protein ACRCSR_05175 [Bacteroidales bacterium]
MYFFIVIIFSLNAVLLGATLLQAQSVKVTNKSELKLSGAYPVLSQQGDALLISSSNYKGLNYYDLKSNSHFIVTEDQGAGYNPIINNGQVLFQSNQFENGRKFNAIKAFDIQNRVTSEILPYSRESRQLSSFDGKVQLTSDSKPMKAIRNFTVSQRSVITKDGKIILINGNEQKELNPVKEARNGYLWVSLSPKGDKILFTAAGLNTYIMDLNGKIVSDLGRVEAPEWYNENWIVGMLTKDDGHTITASDIRMVSSDGKEVIRISDTTEIAMYPSAAGQAGKVAYATADGKVFVLDLTINR